jgi:hypothetical protein
VAEGEAVEVAVDVGMAVSVAVAEGLRVAVGIAMAVAVASENSCFTLWLTVSMIPAVQAASGVSG